MKPKHIYWFAHYNLDAPSVRYRAKYALDEMQRNHGITYSFVYPGYQITNIAHFIKIFFLVLLFRKTDSMIVFQRIYTKGLYSFALKLLLFFRGKRTVYDIDDAEYLNFPPETIHHFMKHCETCSVGSEALLNYTKKFNPRVILLTSPVIYHDLIKKKINELFTIGWVGFYNTSEKNKDEHSHKKNISELFFPALLDIDFKIKLVILGITNKKDIQEIENYFFENKNIIVEIPEHINWQDELSVYRKIKEFDVGISPLLDNECNRAKSAFKLKQYFSCGVPALGNSVGENSVFLKNKVTGFLCETPADYKKNILSFKYMDKNDYYQFSKNARDSVNDFSLEKYCSILSGELIPN